MAKIINQMGEYVTNYYYARGVFSGYEFNFGNKENAIEIDSNKAKDMIKSLSYGMCCLYAGKNVDKKLSFSLV